MPWGGDAYYNAKNIYFNAHISPRFRNFFIHTPKTAGNYIQKTFIENNLSLDKLVFKGHGMVITDLMFVGALPSKNINLSLNI